MLTALLPDEPRRKSRLIGKGSSLRPVVMCKGLVPRLKCGPAAEFLSDVRLPVCLEDLGLSGPSSEEQILTPSGQPRLGRNHSANYYDLFVSYT